MNELKPTESALPTTNDEARVDESLDAYLRADSIVAAINAALPDGVRQLPVIPKGYVFRKRDRESVSTAIHAAFELAGGVPAFLQWGMENPDKFYPLYTKLAQSNTETAVGGTTINFVSAIPQSTLDLVSIDKSGRVVEVDDETGDVEDMPE
jgi:hypothetical protein